MSNQETPIPVTVTAKRRSKPVTGSLKSVFRDRDISFNPMIVPKRESMAEGIEEFIVSLYAKGMSVSDIEEQVKEVYKLEVSTSTISRITSRVAEDIGVKCFNELHFLLR